MRRLCGAAKRARPRAARRIASVARIAVVAEADPEAGRAQPSVEAEAPDDEAEPGAQLLGVRARASLGRIVHWLMACLCRARARLFIPIWQSIFFKARIHMPGKHGTSQCSALVPLLNPGFFMAVAASILIAQSTDPQERDLSFVSV